MARLSAALIAAEPRAKVPTLLSEIAALQEVGFSHEAGDTSLSRLAPQTAGANRVQVFAAAAKRAVETQITRILGENLRRQNMVSWTSLTVADSGMGVMGYNNLSFSGRAHSWVKPLQIRRKGRKPHPTPVLFDVYARACHEEDVVGFQARMDRAQHGRSLPFAPLGLIAAVDFTKPAFARARQEGMLIVNTREFFGEAALNALAAMESLLARVDDDSSAASRTDSADLPGMLDAIRTNPLVTDIKSMAFEAIAALLTRDDLWENVRLGVVVPFGSETREVDVLGQRRGGAQLIAIECKAHHKYKEVAANDVTKFFTETVPALVRTCSGHGELPAVDAQFWTTGIVGTDALRAMAKVKFRRNIKGSFFDLEELLKRVPTVLKRGRGLLQAIAEV